jgi:hypothetical protein
MRLSFYVTFAAICVDAVAQQGSRPTHVRIAVEQERFANCGKVEKFSPLTKPEGADRVYTVELYPTLEGGPATAFMSEHSAASIAGWIRTELGHRKPVAMFYFIDGAYAFRCRDSMNRSYESSSGGNPLQLTSDTYILHFDVYDKQMVYVYVVTKEPLEAVDGDQMLARVSKLLGARFVFLYIRNDPWFYGYVHDSSPFMFVDLSRAISEPEYLKTKTTSCMTGQGCRWGASWP